MWRPNNNVYLPGGLGDTIMLLPYALSCAGITDTGGITPTLNLYMDMTRQKVSEAVLQWQIDLLQMQPYVNEIFYQKKYDTEWLRDNNIINTDYQRHTPSIDMGRGDIMWRNNCLHRCQKYWNADIPWLYLPGDDRYEKYAGKIIVSASPRYYNKFVKWGCLENYKSRCIFIGTQADMDGYYWRTHMLLDFHQVENFIEMAQMIKHCAFFVGTQSFPACLAEATKANRIIIQAPMVPDLIPHGGCGNAVVDEADFSRTLKLYADTFLKIK